MIAAKPHDQLIAELLDSRVPKNEHGWAAAREIESLRSRLSEYEQDDTDMQQVRTQLSASNETLQRRLAEIIAYCAQEGSDGEPYDTINAIASGEYSTRGGGL